MGQLSPVSQIFRLSIIVMEEVEMIYEEDIYESDIMSVCGGGWWGLRQEQWGLNNYKLQGRQRPRTDHTGPGKLDLPGPTSVCLWHGKVTS